MKILFVTHTLPYPPLGGGAIKRWRVIQYLAPRHELTVASLYRTRDLPWKDLLRSRLPGAEFCGELAADCPRNLPNLLKSIREGVPLSVYRNRSRTFAELMAHIALRFDLIFLDSVLVFQFLPTTFSGPVILHQHNAEYRIWERFAALEKNPLVKLAAFLESRRMARYEELAGNRAETILAAPGDRSAIERLGIAPEKFCETLHLGDDSLLELPNIEFENTREGLLFVGNLDWGPNADGLRWFIESVWDRLKGRQPRLTFTIVGCGAGPELARLATVRKDIVLDGFVEDIEPYYARSRVFVAPVRYGGGMKVKVIEAMYRGLPTVTTPLGVESLDVESGCHLTVAESPEEMARGIMVLLNDKKAWERMRDQSRRLAGEKYRWDQVLAGLESAVLSLRKKAPRERGSSSLSGRGSNRNPEC